MITTSPEVSYSGSYRVARAGEVHTVAETVIKPYAMEMVTGVLRVQPTEKLETFHLSNRQISPITGLEWPRGFQKVKVPRLHYNGTGWW